MKQTLRTLLADNKTKQVIEKLKELTTSDADLHDEVIQTAARFNQYEHDKRMNLEDSTILNVERNRIQNTLLSIIDRLSKTNPKEFEPTLSLTAMNLGNVCLQQGKMPETEKYYLMSYSINERLTKKNPQQFEPALARTAVNLGNLYTELRKLVEAEKYYAKSLEIFERLAKVNAKEYEPYIAYVTGAYGDAYMKNKQYEKSHSYLLKALTMRQTEILAGQKQFLGQYTYLFSNLGWLRDSFILEKNYTKAANIQLECAKSVELLKGIQAKGDSIAASAWSDAAWFQVFAKQNAEAEQSAQHGLGLNATSMDIKVNLSHALLFQNKDEVAKKVYQEIKYRSNSAGKSYRTVLKEDFDALEKVGLDKTQIDKARKWVVE